MTAEVETHFNDVPFRPQRDPPADHSLLKKIAGVFTTPVAPASSAPITEPVIPVSAPKGKTTPMTTPAPGSFSASIKAMMDAARAGVAKAREDGLAKVGEAVGKLGDAKTATEKVTGNMVQTIEDEAASIMSELGQISNDL